MITAATVDNLLDTGKLYIKLHNGSFWRLRRVSETTPKPLYIKCKVKDGPFVVINESSLPNLVEMEPYLC